LQGIFIEQDSNNFIRSDFHHDGTNAKTFTATFPGGSPSTLQNEIIASGNAPMYMKIKREGDTWTKYISNDGLSWNESLVFDHTMNVNEVGVFGANAGTSPPEHNAIIDYFFNTDSPIDSEDANSNSLTVNIIGCGSVSKDPDKAEYGCEEVQLIATGDPDWVFDSWSGDLTGDSNPAMIFVDGDKEVNVTFLEGNDTTHPVANYTYSPLNPTDLDTIQFTDLSNDPDGTIVNWTWNFNDGNISYIQNPTHQYTSYGTYIVNLTVRDDDGANDSICKMVNVSTGEINVNISLDMGWNLITLPVDNDMTMASSLAENITGSISVNKWDAVNQTYKPYIVGGPPSFDFPIHPGLGLFVDVDEETTWNGEG